MRPLLVLRPASHAPTRARCRRVSLVFAGIVSCLPFSAKAQSGGAREAAAELVSVSVDVDGSSVPLYRATDGSGRYYLEAREDASYSVSVLNRTPERLGVALVVDGLDAISGERRDVGGWRDLFRRPGRMYVLEPWDDVTVRGWRTSLDDVSRFTFVDERDSYAVRSGKSNSKMGWIEVFVYRERERAWLLGQTDERVSPSAGGAANERGTAEPAPPLHAPSARPAAPADEATPSTSSRGSESADVQGRAKSGYPGTGWGPRAADPVTVVAFEPEARPTERVTLRYEYRESLVALGVLTPNGFGSDRLAEREHGGSGFARAPSR